MLIRLIKTLLISTLCIALNTQAAEPGSNPSIELRSCDVYITADQITKHKGGVTYAGNVKVLIGIANLRLNKVTLVKSKNGNCRLVAAK